MIKRLFWRPTIRIYPQQNFIRTLNAPGVGVRRSTAFAELKRFDKAVLLIPQVLRKTRESHIFYKRVLYCLTFGLFWS